MLMNEESKTCGRCYIDLPLTEFGIARSRPDGRNLYCKKCVRQKVSAGRAQVRARWVQIRAREVARKPMEIWKPTMTETQLRLMRDVNERVLQAIKAGAHSRLEIKEVVGLDWDVVSDSLAHLLFERNVLVTRVADDDRHFFVRRVA